MTSQYGTLRIAAMSAKLVGDCVFDSRMLGSMGVEMGFKSTKLKQVRMDSI